MVASAIFHTDVEQATCNALHKVISHPQSKTLNEADGLNEMLVAENEAVSLTMKMQLITDTSNGLYLKKTFSKQAFYTQSFSAVISGRTKEGKNLRLTMTLTDQITSRTWQAE